MTGREARRLTARFLTGDCLGVLRELPDESVACCVTSPPYWGLRDYGNDSQIGLEPTPEAYVSALVAVFREVRRVLRADGTLWLNLGDSYAAGCMTGRQGSNSSTGRNVGQAEGTRLPARRAPDGLKPKDLVGIPWMVAKALQQPYYTGKIRNEIDRVWLAAMLDAEGCIFIHKRKAGQHNGQGYYRQNDSYGPGVEICNTSLSIVERVHALVGKGSICTSERGTYGRKQTLYRWNLRTTESRDFVREIYPYLVAKQQQARLLVGCPSSGAEAEAAHAALIGLHNGIASSVDFEAPAPMCESGYYLRSDIIWSKNNPMPESVVDRPTKSHEHVFLLSKSERYHYDPAASKEATADGSGERNMRDVWSIQTRPYREAHFAVMPVELAERCLLIGCPRGETVLDPFGGAGTTAFAAEKNGRNSVSIELNPEYVAIAERRLEALVPDTSQAMLPFVEQIGAQ